MGYSNAVEVDLFLAQALTSARPDSTNSKIDLINVGDVRNLNRITNDLVNFFIETADTFIDGALSQLYQLPLQKAANGQWTLDADLDEYNQVVEISDATALVPGNEIVIIDGSVQEIAIVDTIIDQNSFLTLTPIATTFSGSDIRVIRIQFPPPISQVSARLAAGYIYDKYFSAQNSVNTTEYGKEMRAYAIGQLNDVLNGRTILKNQRRIGDLLGNPWLDSAYAHRTPVDGYQTKDRDLSKPS